MVVGEAVVGGRDLPHNQKGDLSWGKGKDDTCRRSSVPLMGLKGLLWQVAGAELAASMVCSWINWFHLSSIEARSSLDRPTAS